MLDSKTHSSCLEIPGLLRFCFGSVRFVDLHIISSFGFIVCCLYPFGSLVMSLCLTCICSRVFDVAKIGITLIALQEGCREHHLGNQVRSPSSRPGILQNTRAELESHTRRLENILNIDSSRCAPAVQS